MGMALYLDITEERKIYCLTCPVCGKDLTDELGSQLHRINYSHYLLTNNSAVPESKDLSTFIKQLPEEISTTHCAFKIVYRFRKVKEKLLEAKRANPELPDISRQITDY